MDHYLPGDFELKNMYYSSFLLKKLKRKKEDNAMITFSSYYLFWD